MSGTSSVVDKYKSVPKNASVAKHAAQSAALERCMITRRRYAVKYGPKYWPTPTWCPQTHG